MASDRGVAVDPDDAVFVSFKLHGSNSGMFDIFCESLPAAAVGFTAVLSVAR